MADKININCELFVSEVTDDQGYVLPGLKCMTLILGGVFQKIIVTDDGMSEPAILANAVCKLLDRTSHFIKEQKRIFP